ncbi:sigma-70 family RNA polymerase sigma factor [Mycobacterium parmense]|uniref:RNA polymerase sigma factor n=1 Tax=Mycobacterium parmense TaxID=185642 RepID=A0A7I7YYQ6_9MYCO|nr:sigma-70 family RNA polymerase sigma factor [Mycobacterium parmense]MCV7350010.1 sigma-70 family RNA polymerase sigma factor [Mycobacterium parmense]ORW59291.1 RNA polymerase subunit sigma-70 [Mycobacterium parmense]BBZ46457.1 RNA polymerase sigma factor [Mycobacterium parmense]
MPDQEDFIERAAPFRAELIAHCYRMLGSVHDAEDLVQETYLRGWRGYPAFEERAALRTWLYRIATTACLRALEGRARRVLPAGLGDASRDAEADLEASDAHHEWLEPIPDTLTPETALAARTSVRLAVMTALQELPARQRAALILRDVVQFSAAEVAELLEITPAAVNSALQRARARLAEVDPDEESLAEPDDAARRALLDRYCSAFENADMAALTELLQADVRLEMPPLPMWFTGRDTVMRFLAARAFTSAGDVVMTPTAANGQPAVAEYRRGAEGVLRAHSIHVLTGGAAGITAITVFLDPGLFGRFGLPPTR